MPAKAKMTNFHDGFFEVSLPHATVPAFWLESCSSTFDAAWELVREGRLPVWGAVLAGAQSAGRGQARRAWLSPPGNLHVSYALPPEIATLGDMASPAAGWLAQQALAALSVPVRLKWPNDILLESADAPGKAGGILLEEREGVLLAGLGVNLLHTPSAEALRPGHAVPAASLAAYSLTPRDLWPDLARRMHAVCAGHVAGRTPDYIRQRVEKALAWKGLAVRAGEGDAEIRGLFAGIDEAGRARLIDTNGVEQFADSGGMRRDPHCIPGA